MTLAIYMLMYEPLLKPGMRVAGRGPRTVPKIGSTRFDSSPQTETLPSACWQKQFLTRSQKAMIGEVLEKKTVL